MIWLLACAPVPVDTGTPPEECEAFPAWADGDGDGFGAEGTMRLVCELSPGTADNDDDCDDGDAAVHPAASEICNGLDDDCAGGVDDGADDATTWWLDHDGDGYGGGAFEWTSCDAPSGYVGNDADCDDLDASVSPDGVEVCDGIDQDCDGLVDDNAEDALTWYVDGDGDGHGSDAVTVEGCEAPEGYVASTDDCDDAVATTHPGADELCNDVDDDCDGSTDFDGWIPGAYASIEAAVEHAPDGAHLCLEAGDFRENELELQEKSLTLQGETGAAIDAGGSWLFQLDQADLALVDLEVRDLAPSSYSGALVEGYGSDLTLDDVTVHDVECSTYYGCGGLLIELSEGDLTLTDVSVHDVTASGEYSYASVEALVADIQQGTLTVDGLDVYDLDLATDFGGLFYTELEGRSQLRDITLRDSVFRPKHSWYGGVVYAYEGLIEIEDVAITGNTVTFDEPGSVEAGLAIECAASVEATRVQVVGNTFDNVERMNGLAAQIYESGYVSLQNLVVAGNVVTPSEDAGELYGGFVIVDYADVDIAFADFAHNDLGEGWSEAYGGVIYASESDVLLSHVTVHDLALGSDDLHGTVGWFEYDGAADDMALEYADLSQVDAPWWGFYDDESAGPSPAWETDPLYEDTSSADPTDWDLRLSSASPLIDAGDPSCQDTDGTVCDVGAYGGPGGSW